MILIFTTGIVMEETRFSKTHIWNEESSQILKELARVSQRAVRKSLKDMVTIQKLENWVS